MSVGFAIFAIITLIVLVAFAVIETILGIKMEKRAAKDDEFFRAESAARVSPRRRSKITSRKFWMAVLGVALGFATVCLSYRRYAGFVTKAGVIMMMLSILLYIVMEALVDMCGTEDKIYFYDGTSKIDKEKTTAESSQEGAKK